MMTVQQLKVALNQHRRKVFQYKRFLGSDGIAMPPSSEVH
jgi:hypothetical protein